MCVIHVCPRGTEKYSERVLEFIKHGITNNNQGSGFMFKRAGDNKITVDKGYFNYQDLIKALESYKLTEDDELIIHHRRVTHGLTNAENCHPYFVSKDKNITKAVSLTKRLPAIVHNGQFNCNTETRYGYYDYSDTFTFANSYLSNKYIMGLFKNDKKSFGILMSGVLGNSKLAVLYPNRDLDMFGIFIEDSGYFHSNDGYKERYEDYGGYGQGWVGYYGGNNHNQSRPIATPKIIALPQAHDEKNEFFDNDDIEITEKNFKFFKFVLKSDYDNYLDFILNTFHNNYTTYHLDSFDKDSETLILYYEKGDQTIGKAVSPERLSSGYYYFPNNNDIKMIVNDFCKLKKLLNGDTPGTKSIRKLKALLNKSSKLEPTDTVHYDKFGCKFSLLALQYYYDHLVKLKDVNSGRFFQELVVDFEETFEETLKKAKIE